MSELLIRLSYTPVIAWIVVVALFAGFVFFIATTQLNVKFSDEKVTEEKRGKISSEVFGNLLAFMVFVGIIFALALIGFYSFTAGRAEVTVSSEPGEIV